jgi:type II secretory pathway component PulJ
MVSLGITAIIFTIASTALSSMMSNTRARQGQAQALERVVKVVDYVSGLLREAQPSPTGAYPVVAASTTSITFYASRSGSQIQKIRFFLNGTKLQQGVIEPSGSPATYPAANEQITTLLENVSSTTIFSYYTGSYTGTQAAMNPITTSSIRMVRLTVTFDPAANLAPGPYTIDIQSHLRNLKDNY